jgi:hypothetical protein
MRTLVLIKANGMLSVIAKWAMEDIAQQGTSQLII